MSQRASSHKWPIGVLMAAVLAWGFYLAVGASAFNRDLRKGFIVFGCVAAFVMAWLAVLLGRRSGRLDNSTDDECAKPIGNRRTAWSVPSITSFVLVLLGTGLFSTFEWGLFASKVMATRAIGLITPMLMAAALILAMIGLSDPRMKRGKWLALVALMTILCVTVSWLYLRSWPSLQRVGSGPRHDGLGGKQTHGLASRTWVELPVTQRGTTMAGETDIR